MWPTRCCRYWTARVPKSRVCLIESLVELASSAVRRADAGTRNRARLEVVDAVGCMVRGSNHPMVQRLSGLAAVWPSAGPSKPVAAPHGSFNLDHAIVVDALAVHVDEFDALHPSSASVPAAAVMASVLALARSRHLSGSQVSDAVIAGYEVLAAVGEHFGGSRLYSRGWWPTSTFAAVGAAAGVSILLGLERDQTCHALGLAATVSGGLLSDGRLSEGHYLSAARASARGALAAVEAEAGLEASWQLLDGPASQAFMPDHLLSPYRSGRVDGEATTLAVDQCVIKWFPCARPLHGVVEALRELRATGIDLGSLTQVEVAVHPDVRAFVTAEREVEGPTEAAASAVFVVDAARLGRETEVSYFRGAQLGSGAPQVTLGMTHVTDEIWSARVRCTDMAGKQHERWGSPTTEADSTRVAQKFIDNLTAVGWPAAQSHHLLGALNQLDSHEDVATLPFS